MSLARRTATAAVLVALAAATAPGAAAAPAPAIAPASPAVLATPSDPALETGPIAQSPQSPAGPAAPANPADPTVPHGPTSLVLSVTTATRSLGPASPHSVTLRCDPASGPHPYAGDACSELAAADGGFDHIATTRRMCPMIFAPVTATATGTWQGRPVHWSEQFANGCVLAQRTGDVFRF